MGSFSYTVQLAQYAVFVKAVFAPSHSVFPVKLRPAELRGLGGARGLELSWRRFTDRWTTQGPGIVVRCGVLAG
jgi:hypothetical protein